jgi:hypothetical protein
MKCGFLRTKCGFLRKICGGIHADLEGLEYKITLGVSVK